MDWGLYLALGAFAGLLAGLLGVGGGLIIVPALAWMFAHQGVNPEVIMHLALGTSLASIVITSISSVRSHHQHGAVLWPAFWKLTPGIVLGASLGGIIASHLSTSFLKPLFGLFELGVGLQMLLYRPPLQHSPLPGPLIMGSAGSVIGIVSSLVGIGGGTLTVPFLVWNSVGLRQAIATSAACGLPIAISGSLSYIANGWNNSMLPNQALGYVHTSAFLGIILASMLFAPLGAKLTHTLPVTTLKKFFGVFLIILAIKLLLSDF